MKHKGIDDKYWEKDYGALEKENQELKKQLEEAIDFISHIYEISDDIDVTRQSREFLAKQGKKDE